MVLNSFFCILLPIVIIVLAIYFYWKSREKEKLLSKRMKRPPKDNV